MLILGVLTRIAAFLLLIDISVAIFSTRILFGYGFRGFSLPELPRYGLLSILHEARTDFSRWVGLLFCSSSARAGNGRLMQNSPLTADNWKQCDKPVLKSCLRVFPLLLVSPRTSLPRRAPSNCCRRAVHRKIQKSGARANSPSGIAASKCDDDALKTVGAHEKIARGFSLRIRPDDGHRQSLRRHDVRGRREY